ncbi:MAG: hypothetical protein RLY71_1432 [Pseudomonadota bacterium]|jgi:hypothetical protein
MGHLFQYKSIAAMVVLAMLSACGGGGGSDTTSTTACASLISGTYRMVMPGDTLQTRMVNIDATNLTVSQGADSAKLTPVANCRYTVSTGESLVVSGAGVGLVLKSAVAGKQLGVIFPEQTLPASSLAGVWNTLDYSSNAGGTAYVLGASVATINTSGQVTSLEECSGLAACVPNPSEQGTFTANPAGGFDYIVAGALEVPRAFFYRAANGSRAMVMLTASGVVFGAPQNTQVMPAVNSVSNFWDLTLNTAGLTQTTDFVDSSTTVTGIDTPTAGSFTRKRASDGRADTVVLNTPRLGMRYRMPGTSVLDNGTTVAVSENFYLPLQGLGVTVYGGTNFFGASVTKP